MEQVHYRRALSINALPALPAFTGNASEITLTTRRTYDRTSGALLQRATSRHEAYTFADLSPDAQERAIVAERNVQAECLMPDELDDSEYWTESFLDPVGFTVTKPRHARSWQSGIFWSHDGWDGFRSFFRADVDVERFILAHSLGRTFALLLSAARRGEVYGASVGTDDGERRVADAEVSLDTYGFPENLPRQKRLENQADALEDRILAAYHAATDKIDENLREQWRYLTGEEYARETLADFGMMFDVNGTRL